jgi:hypothetical protein
MAFIPFSLSGNAAQGSWLELQQLLQGGARLTGLPLQSGTREIDTL